MKIALCAGESSGDALGAGLIRALRERYPDASFTGLAGPKMVEAGCEPLPGYEQLSVMGLVEVLGSLPKLLRLRRRLAARLAADRPACFIGLDAPDFNLGLERRLRAASIPTAHYVSPSVWAWRPGRVESVAAACDLLLCLFPFEPAWYRHADVEAVAVGHPLADAVPLSPDRAAARDVLGVGAESLVLVLMPGSRRSEVNRLGGVFAQAARRLADDHPDLEVVVPVARPSLRPVLEQLVRDHAPDLPVRWLDGDAHTALAAGNLALLASGTATLEAMLFKVPMVAAYRVSAISHWLFKGLGLLPLDRYALPNILAGRDWVPERMQAECTPDSLHRALEAWLDEPERVAAYRDECTRRHEGLRRNASRQAAAAVATLIERGGRG